MSRFLIGLALAGIVCSGSGCCCYRALFPQTVATVAPAPAPVYPPAYVDPCATPVTYGTAPVGTYGPATVAPGW